MQLLVFRFLDLPKTDRLEIARSFGIVPALVETDAEWSRRTMQVPLHSGRLQLLEEMVMWLLGRPAPFECKGDE
jgi:hypothetical protein